jgi:hypothetical protein
MDKNLEIISVTGARGGGKTTKVLDLINDRKRKRVLIYDLKNEYKYKKINGLAELGKFLKTNWYKNFKISYIPHAREKIEHIEELSKLCFAIADAQQKDEAQNKGNNLTLVVEEMSVTAPNVKYPQGMGGFEYCVNVAREWGVEIIGVCQRPAQSNPDFRGNATHCYYFNLSDNNDIKAVKSKLGNEADNLKLLTVGEYVKFHHGQVSRGKTRKK